MAVDLLDSLARGYPVGSLLVWGTTKAMPFRAETGMADLDDGGTKARSYLLDGQQRLRSVLMATRPTDDLDGPRIRYDLLTREWRVGRPGDDIGVVDSWDALDPAVNHVEVLARSGIRSDSDDWAYAAESLVLSRAIMSTYMLPAMHFQEDDMEVVADIFIRINQSGRRLGTGDLVYSAVVARWPWMAGRIDRLDQEMEAAGWPVSKESMLRVLGILSGAGSRQMNLVAADVSERRARAGWNATEKVLWEVASFGRSAGYRWSGLMPPGSVVTCAYALHTAPDLDRSELAAWTYASLLFEDRNVRSSVEAEVSLLGRYPGMPGVTRMIERALVYGGRDPESTIGPDDVRRVLYPGGFRMLNLLQALYLADGAPDWLPEGGALVGDADEIEQHHIFPRQHMKGLVDETEINSIGNIAYISDRANATIGSEPPASYLRRLPVQALRAQDIPEDPELWRTDRFRDFLDERCRLVSTRVRRSLGLP